ncbi:hypothetical protein ACX4ZB_01175 [Aerococcus urinae]
MKHEKKRPKDRLKQVELKVANIGLITAIISLMVTLIQLIAMLQ